MLETVRKAMLAGLGAMDLTEEKFHAFLSDLTKRGELTEQEAREFGHEWRQRLSRRRDELQQEVREAVQRALRSLNVATRQEVDALAARVGALERQSSAERRIDPEC